MHQETATTQIETEKDLQGSEAREILVKTKRWASEIERAKKHYDEYWNRVDTITERYRVEDKARKNTRRYNVLWSMTNTVIPNLFMGIPKPYVYRRFRDKDPIARYASLILQRSLIYVNDGDDTHDALGASVLDFVLGARGVVWNRYSPEFDLRTSERKTRYVDDKELPAEGEYELGEDADGKFYQEQYEALENEECETDHVQTRMFLTPPGSTWKQLPWIARGVLMTREDLVERFGDRGKSVPLTWKRPDGKTSSKTATDPQESEGLFSMALIWEVWDKTKRQVIWITDEKPEILDTKEDPLRLTNFFPCPRPLFGTLTNNSVIPVPDYKYYEDVSHELDAVTYRISLLTESIRVVGFYDADMGDTLARVMDQTGDNKMIRIENMASLAEKGGIERNIFFMPLEPMIKVLESLYRARAALVQELYEITGISDIVRGQSDPRETAKAQTIKGQFASKRLKIRQRQVARFAREHLEIQAEIICNHYDDETILRISGADQFVTGPDGKFSPELFSQALALLRNKPLRCFRIKIDNETLAGDELEGDREQGIQFLQSFSQMVAQVMPLAQQQPQLGRVLKDMLLFGVRLFPIGREMEGSLEQALEEMTQDIRQPEQEKPQPTMSPEELALRNREIDLRERELGIQRQKLLLEEKKMNMNDEFLRWKTVEELKVRVLDQKRQAHSKDRELDIREDEVEARAEADAERNQIQREQVGDRREHEKGQRDLAEAKLTHDVLDSTSERKAAADRHDKDLRARVNEGRAKREKAEA